MWQAASALVALGREEGRWEAGGAAEAGGALSRAGSRHIAGP